MSKMREVIAKKELSSSARLAYCWLVSTKKRDGYSYESNEAVGEVLGVRVETVSQLARELTEAGLVRREGCGKGSAMGGRKRWLIIGAAAIAFFTGETQPAPAQSSEQAVVAKANPFEHAQ